MLRISFEIWSYNLDIDGIDFIIDDVVMDTIYMDGVNYFNLCPYSSFNGYNVGLAAE